MAEMIKMKEQVVAKYGEDSFEAGYIQHVFANRSSEHFKHIFNELMGKEN